MTIQKNPPTSVGPLVYLTAPSLVTTLVRSRPGLTVMSVMFGHARRGKGELLCTSALPLLSNGDQLNNQYTDGTCVPTTRNAPSSGTCRQRPLPNALMCSPLPKLPVTAAPCHPTVYPQQCQQGSSVVGQLLPAPPHILSQWNGPLATSQNTSVLTPSAKEPKQRPRSWRTARTVGMLLRRRRARGRFKPRAQLPSRLPSASTQADHLIPITVDAYPPLSPSPESRVTWHSSETLNADQSRMVARSRSSSSAVSAIIPTKG
jgi:hypothetical protein